MRREKLEELNSYLKELQVVTRIKKDIDPRFISSEVYEIHLKCGSIFLREKLLKGKKDGSAAIIFALTKNNEVLLNVEPRVFTKEGVQLGFPAGYIELGEDKEVGARRELKEEHGYQAGKMILLDEAYQDEGCSSALNSLFLAYDCEQVTSQHLDQDEIIKPFKCTYDEVLELNALGYFKSFNSKLLIERVKEYIKRR